MKKLSKDTVQAINNLRELLTRDSGGTGWGLSMTHGDFYFGFSENTPQDDYDTTLPLTNEGE